MSVKTSQKFIALILIFHIIYSISIEMSNSEDIKIMCIGDSITFGHRFPGSYRKFLYHNLLSKGYKIKMVGAKDNTIEKYKDFEFQNDNSGYSAYTISNYKHRKGLLEVLQQTKCLKLNPDIIILLIGTNNVMDNINFDITTKTFISLIEYILNNINNNTMVFVSNILDMDPNHKINYNWFDNYRKNNTDDDEVKKIVNDNVFKYNNKIKEIVDIYRKKNYNIKIENLNDIIKLKDFDNLMLDGVHPNDNGYEKIGEFWTEIIDNYLKEINHKI